MINPDTEIGYAAQYQKPDDPAWYEHTNHAYEHPIKGGLYSETSELIEALDAARGLVEGTVFNSRHPQYRDKIVAARVVQRIHTGGVLLVMGTPQT